ncbi:MAG: hypothetical protein E6J62_14740 [Deltaproteobacteria bacterium]|nr:MAG: hypothetical protein E6J61_19330 [Deltaproteobacteria bacterium]TMB30595.1 MAG: hypothetical protein E6J62_14740 [Deltaproteobacteria bacterium]
MRRIAIPLIALAAAACGGSGSSGPTEAPLNITASGIASNTGSTSITIPVGGRVHYFNKDTVAHQITSPCAELNMATPLAAGGNQLQPVMNTSEGCNLTDSANAALTATVSVAAPTPGGGGGGGSGY